MFSLGVAVASLGLVGLAVLAILAIPVWLVGDIERTDRQLHARLRVRWLFGLLDVALSRRPPRASPAAQSAQPRQPQRVESRAARRRRRGPAMALALVRTEGLAARILQLVRDLATRFSFQGLYLRCEFGLDDPADTGRLYGTLAPFLVAAGAGGADVRCQPDFQDACLRGACGGQIRVRPISLLGVVVRFLCSRPMLRALRAVWVARR